MDAVELRARVLECLRGLEIGESISADGIADEIGEKLSDVYDAIEGLEEARLVELHPAYRKGNDPTYTLTTKGKHHKQLEILEQLEPEPVKVDQGIPEVRTSADRVCRFCGKVLDPNKLRRHENMCGKNPERPSTQPKFLKPARPKEEPAVEVPDSSEYAEESTSSITIEHEAPVEPEFPEILEQLNTDVPDAPDEIPAPLFDESEGRIVERIETAVDMAAQVQEMTLESTPGMDRLLMLLNQCQGALRSGVIMTLDSEIVIEPGLTITIRMEGGARNAE